VRAHRRELGERFSEGARQLWLVVEREGLTHKRLRERIGRGFDVTRWLYGDSVPPVAALVRIEELWGIRVALWLQKPRHRFVPPAVRKAA
jgi:hypothetical protein